LVSPLEKILWIKLRLAFEFLEEMFAITVIILDNFYQTLHGGTESSQKMRLGLMRI
jgi:hypothetical protein